MKRAAHTIRKRTRMEKYMFSMSRLSAENDVSISGAQYKQHRCSWQWQRQRQHDRPSTTWILFSWNRLILLFVRLLSAHIMFCMLYDEFYRTIMKNHRRKTKDIPTECIYYIKNPVICTKKHTLQFECSFLQRRASKSLCYNSFGCVRDATDSTLFTENVSNKPNEHTQPHRVRLTI